MSGLDTILEKPGETTRIARALGINTQAISQWKQRGYVPPGRVLDVERVTGVHRHFLNPDIYPDPPEDEEIEDTEQA